MISMFKENNADGYSSKKILGAIVTLNVIGLVWYIILKILKTENNTMQDLMLIENIILYQCVFGALLLGVKSVAGAVSGFFNKNEKKEK